MFITQYIQMTKISHHRTIKGAILAGGKGTRLRPLTRKLNKHLLPVYDRLMVTFPIETLKRIGINHICIVTEEKDYQDFVRFMGDGNEQGVKIEYRTQKDSLGLADAVYQTMDFFGPQKPIIILGDDIFSYLVLPAPALKDNFAYAALTPAKGIGIIPNAVAVPELANNGTIVGVSEKPKNPISKFMVCGFYVFTPDVYGFIKSMKPSERGELEISDITNWYAKNGRLKPISDVGFVADAGSLDSLLEASIWRSKVLKREREASNE